jgi:DNA-directed RNA polymerase II subunit RPB2
MNDEMIKEEYFDNEKDEYIELPWLLIDSYFKNNHLNRLVRHQIESYNYFVDYQLKKTIEMFNPVNVKSYMDYDTNTKQYLLEMFISFENLKIYTPQIYENNGSCNILFPQVARLRNYTYSSTMMVDIHVKYIKNNENEGNKTFYKTIPNVNIGKLPIMLKSNICVLKQLNHLSNKKLGECEYDAGGYFVINGSEKTIISQERPGDNMVFCFHVSKTKPKFTYMAEINSVPDYKCISPKQIKMMICSKKNEAGYPIVMKFPRMKQSIPLFIVFRALGVISDKRICEIILLNIQENKTQTLLLECLKASIIEANKYLTQDECFTYISSYTTFTTNGEMNEEMMKKKYEFTKDILQNDLFPHCPDFIHKIYFMGYMTNKLLKVSLQLLSLDDRDSYVNKRIDLAGTLMNNLYRNYFNKLVKNMEKKVIHEIELGGWKSKNDFENIINDNNIYKFIKSTIMENGLRTHLSTGDFGVNQSNVNKVGVAQVLNRLTYPSTLSHLRRTSTPMEKTGKLIPPRKLHSTSWGFICSSETPEGPSVGIVKNLAYMTHITIPSHSDCLYDIILPHIINITDNMNPNDLYNKVKVIINGAWIGITENPIELYHFVKDKKYKGIINIYTSITFNLKKMEIYICNDGGRLTRPLLKIKNNHLLLTKSIIQGLENSTITWNDLLTNINIKESVIEYIDPDEQNEIMIANKPKDITNPLYTFTHCEIHPSTILGILASCIPFPEHNQSPRNTYQCAQGKQAIGIYATNYENRMDKTSYILNYPMRPLVDTRIMNILKLNKIPSGCNVIIAIMSHTGYNQEDSILFNKGSIDRGLFGITLYHTEKDEEQNGDDVKYGKPIDNITKGVKLANYDKVDSNGLVAKNTLIRNRDIILSKIQRIKENKNDNSKTVKYVDQSKTYKTIEETFIDKNYTDKNGDGYDFVKIKLRTYRKPVYGDKFSSRHGQKGTIGNIIPEYDMPFTSDGLQPDIIINPHAIPSRMTIGHTKEEIVALVILVLGLFGDGTPFENLDLDNIRKLLSENGYESHGNQILYNGMTGKQFESSIFIGPVFYQRLKHMVNDKVHSRSLGKNVNLTRQPAEGRTRDGGLKFGEMETQCMISHGASRFTKERMYDVSDKFHVHVCNKCGIIAQYNDVLNKHQCSLCYNQADFSYVEIPYSCKILFQELNTMNIAPRIICST